MNENKPEFQLGDAPIVPELHSLMNDLARALDKFFNEEALSKGGTRETGFVLLTFPYGNDTGRCNFISNGADRGDLICLFKEMIARFEGQPEMRGNG